MYQGSEVTTLDESGAGSIAFQLSEAELIELTLDTSSNPALLPRSPTLPVPTRVGSGDDLVVLDFAFTERKKPKPKRWSVPRPARI